jgi:hypothetical protein
MAIGTSKIGEDSGKQFTTLKMGPKEASKLAGLILDSDAYVFGDDIHIDRIINALLGASVIPTYPTRSFTWEE